MDIGAVILAGGTAARLGGVDKASIELAGLTFLEHALLATAAAQEVVVVGDQVPTSRPVTFVREDPPLGGPLAGLAAGRHALSRTPDLLWVQAVDMPRVTATTYARLTGALGDHAGAVLCDPTGRRQLTLVVRPSALDAVLPDDPHGRPLHRLLPALDLVEVAGRHGEAADVDTWRDVAGICDT